MSKASLAAIVRYCDTLLRTAAVQDYDRAANGLQVENSGRVTRIAASVDASLATVKLAVAAKADLLLVHHGLFWGATHPWTGKRRELLAMLLENNLAVYSSHLPLDAHPKFGNNAQLCAALGLKPLRPFFFDHGQHIGFRAEAKLARAALAKRLQQATASRPLLIPGGPEICRRIGVVSGGAGSDVQKAADEGVDTFVTGEGPHWTYALAENLGLNVLYGGHYATETFGVKALAAHLSSKFKLPWTFLITPPGSETRYSSANYANLREYRQEEQNTERKLIMTELIMKEDVYAIIGAAMEVHREKGYGFAEPVYQECMEFELMDRDITAVPQKEMPIFYKGRKLKKTYIADFIVFGKIIVELKAIDRLTSKEESQVINYLKASGFELGILINFGAPSLEWKRIVLTKPSPGAVDLQPGKK